MDELFENELFVSESVSRVKQEFLYHSNTNQLFSFLLQVRQNVYQIGRNRYTYRLTSIAWVEFQFSLLFFGASLVATCNIEERERGWLEGMLDDGKSLVKSLKWIVKLDSWVNDCVVERRNEKEEEERFWRERGSILSNSGSWWCCWK